jgi:CheY-like chemotaxis protein
MTSKPKKSIFWFEDDGDALDDYSRELQKKYDIIMGATREEVLKNRDHFFDLLLLDLMIHIKSYTGHKPKKENNIMYEGVHWMQTGVEFLSRIRKGEYEKYGFKSDIPVIVVTAILSYPGDEMEKIGINIFLPKPVTLPQLEEAIEKILTPS